MANSSGDVSVLGDLVVNLGVDSSNLGPDLDGAVGKIENAGKEITEALNGLGDGATKGLDVLNNALNDASVSGDRLGVVAQAINAEYAEQMQRFVDAQQALENVRAAYDNNAASAGQLAAATKEVKDSYEAMNPPAEKASSVFGDMESKLGSLAAGFLSFQALKGFAEDALAAAAATERWTTGMTALTKNAGEVADELATVKEMALTMAVPFESLLKTTQQLTAEGLQFSQVTSVIQAAQDAAVATGRSFDQVVGALERVYATGQLSARQIQQLGLTWEQLAESAGMSIADVQAYMKKGGATAEEQLNLLLVALDKFRGAGAAATKDLTGQWQVFKNALSEDMDAIGTKLASFVRGVASLSNALAAMTGGLIGSFASTKKGVEELGPVLVYGQGVTGKWISAQQELNQALTDARTHLAEVKTALNDGLPVQAAYADAVKAVDDAEKKADPLGYAAKKQAQADAQRAAAEAAREEAKRQNELQTEILKGAAAAGAVSRDIDQIGASWNKYYNTLGDLLDRIDAGYDISEKNLLALAKANDELANSFEKDIQKAEKYSAVIDEQQRANNAALQAQVTARRNVAEALREQVALMNETAQQSKEEVKGVLQVQETYQSLKQVIFDLGQAVKVPIQQTKEWDSALKSAGITAAGVGHDLSAIFKDGVVQTQSLNAAWQQTIDKLQQSKAILEAVLAAEVSNGASLETQLKTREAILKVQQQLNDVTGANDGNIQQTNLDLAVTQTKLQLATAEANILADAWKGMTKAFDTAFKGFADGIAQCIVEGKSFGDTMLSVVQKLAEAIISQLVQMAMLAFLKSLQDGTSFISEMSSAFSSMLNGFKSVSQAAVETTNAVNSGASSAVGNIQSVGSSALSVINTISGVVTAVFSGLSYFTERHMAADLTKIEKSTRYTEIYTGEQGDSILSTVHSMLEVLKTIDGDIKGVTSAVQNIKVGTGTGTSGTSTASAPTDLLAADQASRAQDPWYQGYTVLMQAMSGVQNATIKFALAGAALQALVSGDFTTATMALRSAGLNLDQVTGVFQQLGLNVINMQDRVSTSIDMAIGNIESASGVTAQAMQTLAAAQQTVAVATVGVAAAVMDITPAAAAIQTPEMSVGGLDSHGNLIGAPGKIDSPYVSGGPSITINLQAGVVAGNNGMQQLTTMMKNALIKELQLGGGLKGR